MVSSIRYEGVGGIGAGGSAENKYDKSISMVEYLNPAPNEKNFRAPFNSFSLKNPWAKNMIGKVS